MADKGNSVEFSIRPKLIPVMSRRQRLDRQMSQSS